LTEPIAAVAAIAVAAVATAVAVESVAAAVAAAPVVDSSASMIHLQGGYGQ
jgi:hypothetical protein